MTQATQNPFIQYLQSLADNQDRGALAALRRGLGQPAWSVPEMYPYVVPRLPANLSAAQEAAYYLTASLFALHPKSTAQGNLGGHLAQAKQGGNEDAIERRFTALLAAHPDDLPGYLRQAVSFLKSKEIPVNWEQLLYDLQAWEHPDRRARVQKEWARAFWGRPAEQSEAPSTSAQA